MPSPSSPPRSNGRRGTQEVRTLLLNAARELFTTKGYDATTTKEISSKSGVSEPVLFSNFGSKAGLFDAAVASPFAEAVSRYEASWRETSTSTETRVERFVADLLDLARENKVLLLSALLRRSTASGDEEAELLDHIAGVFQSMKTDTVLHERATEYGLDTPVAIAATAGMVISVGLLDDLFFPHRTKKPSRKRLVAELTNLILYGVASRPQQSRSEST